MRTPLNSSSNFFSPLYATDDPLPFSDDVLIQELKSRGYVVLWMDDDNMVDCDLGSGL